MRIILRGLQRGDDCVVQLEPPSGIEGDGRDEQAGEKDETGCRDEDGKDTPRIEHAPYYFMRRGADIDCLPGAFAGK